MVAPQRIDHRPEQHDAAHARIDFGAAGSVLNWAAQQQGHGRVVQFINLHRLVAVFFNVVGVNEHAWVVPRKD